MTVTIFVPDLPEFMPLVRAAEAVTGCIVVKPQDGYWRVKSENQLRFSRKELGLGHAIWNSALSGGYLGKITEYGRDFLIIEGDG